MATITTTAAPECKKKVCDVGADLSGRLLPLFGETENEWQKVPGRAILYLIGLFWFFTGVAIVSDIFMGAIERITSKKVRVLCEKTNKKLTVKVWNDTVANLTLMALGSSAPEILLSVIELASNSFISGDLGPSTIVGSAAFNLFVISAVCVYAIPSDDIRLIKDVGVFAVTGSCSIFAYLWLYFIVAISSPDEITVFEGSLTFIFFPVLVIMAFIADKGYFTCDGAYDAQHDAPKCPRSHDMEYLATSRDDDGWGCDGRFQPGGCRSGITGYHQTKGIERYRCEKCDYDLCRKCVESGRRAAQTHIISSDISKEELAAIELRIMQTHGDALSDDQLALLIKKHHSEPMSRAAHRVAATRAMLGGKRLGGIAEEENSYSLTAIVPVDGSCVDGPKRPVLCPSGHSMHSFLTKKANFSCDICQKQFPIGTVLYGCRSCNFDACVDCKGKFVKADVSVQFCSSSYAVLESIGTLTVHVTRSGDLSQKVWVEYRTREGSAKSPGDFIHVEGKLEFDVGEVQKTVAVQIVDDDSFEEDEDFFIDLFNAGCANDKVKVVVGENRSAMVSIIDDDLPGVLSFAEESLSITEGIENKVLTCSVQRREGSSGHISCQFRTEDGTAAAGKDYLAAKGMLDFEPGQMSREISLTILAGHKYESTEEFRIILSDPTGGAKLDEKTDGGAETCICTIAIDSDEAAAGRVDRVMKVLMMDWDKAQIGHANWKDQFTAAIMVNGGEEDAQASFLDWVMHVITIFWKVLFAIIPPTDFCDGWVCFVCSLAMIGVVTAFIGQLAELLGCALDIPDKITAITFVALGTSLPDTFASKTAAEQDPYADAAIGNVTGSNSVNVFLGLGLPWLMGSVYWAIVGKNQRWKDEYSTGFPAWSAEGDGIGRFVVIGGDLGFGVGIFSGCAVAAIGCLIVRRKLFGGELGGPDGPKKATSVFLVSLWLLYIGLSSWKILSSKEDCR